MTGLRRTEQIAGTADLEIAHRYLDAGAKIRVFPDRCQTLLCNLPQDLVLLVH